MPTWSAFICCIPKLTDVWSPYFETDLPRTDVPVSYPDTSMTARRIEHATWNKAISLQVHIPYNPSLSTYTFREVILSRRRHVSWYPYLISHNNNKKIKSMGMSSVARCLCENGTRQTCIRLFRKLSNWTSSQSNCRLPGSWGSLGSHPPTADVHVGMTTTERRE